MSISQARTFIEKSGCGHVVGIVLIIVLVIGLFASGTCNNPNDQGQGAADQPKTALGKVGDQVIALENVRQNADLYLNQFGSTSDGIDPVMLADSFGVALVTEVDRTIIRHLSNQKQITTTDDEIKAEALAGLDAEIARLKQQLVQMGQIKPEATPAEIDAVLKKLGQPSMEEIKSAQTEQVLSQLGQPEYQAQVEYQLLAKKLRVAYEQGTTISDEDLKKSMEKHVTKRIFFNEMTAKAGDDIYAKAEKVLAEIKGGLNFEDAINKYSDDPAQTGKKKSDSTVDLDVGTMTYDDAYKTVLPLKAGEMSGVIKTSGGPAIFKVIKISPMDMKPEEFAKQKESLKKNRASLLAGKKLSEEMRGFLGEGKITWSSETAKHMYEWRTALFDPELRGDKKAQQAKLASLWDKVKSLSSASDPADPKMGAMLRYGLFKMYYDGLNKADQDKMKPDWFEETVKAVAESDHAPTRYALAKHALEINDAAAFTENLKAAMSANYGSEAEAITRYKDHVALLKSAIAKSFLKSESVTELQTEADRFKKDIYESIKSDVEGNADYGREGLAAIEAAEKKVKNFVAAGFITNDQASEVASLKRKWAEDAASSLKTQSEDNVDYSDLGQNKFQDINFMVTTLRAKGLMTEAQAKAIEAAQAKWSKAKLEADKKEEEASKAQKPAGSDPTKNSSSTLTAPPSTTGGR